MNKLLVIKSQYLNGYITKNQFINKIYDECHQLLFDYSDLIRETNIKKIEILDENIKITTRDKGLIFECLKSDKRNHPFEILNFDNVERYELAMMDQILNTGSTIFDIGGNIGWVSINLAISDNTREIYTFEPSPVTYLSLLNNIRINYLKNIKAYNIGLSNTQGEFDFYFNKNVTGNSSLNILSNLEEVEKIVCSIDTLDNFISNNNIFKLDLIKCDVEGAEFHVFQGATNTISKLIPIVFSEITRKYSKVFNYDPNKIFDFFSNYGYSSFTVEKNKLIKFNLMDESTIETNFFFLHNKKHFNLINKYTL